MSEALLYAVPYHWVVIAVFFLVFLVVGEWVLVFVNCIFRAYLARRERRLYGRH